MWNSLNISSLVRFKSYDCVFAFASWTFLFEVWHRNLWTLRKHCSLTVSPFELAQSLTLETNVQRNLPYSKAPWLRLWTELLACFYLAECCLMQCSRIQAPWLPQTGPYVAVHLATIRMNASLGLACVCVCFLCFFPPTPISVDDCRMRNNGRKIEHKKKTQQEKPTTGGPKKPPTSLRR